MGACFEAFIPYGDVSMGYRRVHTIRRYLMRMFGEDVLEQYVKVMNEAPLAETQEETEDAERRFDELMESLKGEHAFGVRSFVNHSDCDGTFNTEQCEYIAKALCALTDTDIVQDEEERDFINELADVFRDAYQHDGLVRIW